jgi:hypothetical protein
MVSNIDPTVPSSPTAYTADMRANFAAAKEEIEELQALSVGSGSFLPLTGGTLTGPLVLPLGTPSTPALEFGDQRTGFYSDAAGSRLILRVGGQVSWIWDSNGPLLLTPFDVDGQRVVNMADPVDPSDAVTKRYADTTYTRMRTQITTLEDKVSRLEKLVVALSASPRFEIGHGMPTDLLVKP